MQQIIVNGPTQLKGNVRIEGAKNAALPILAATILASKGKTSLTNIPPLSDVITMSKVLKALNANVSYDEIDEVLTVDTSEGTSTTAPEDLVDKMRASIVVLGPLLARNKEAHVAMPGGCAIGSRPIDLHIKGLEAMGAKFNQNGGYIDAKTDGLHGANIYLDFPSVGATQNIMMAATLADGETTIDNAAREPEIVDLANVLSKMGADVSGAGTNTVRINGVSSLHGCEHSIMQDRIEAGTFMVAAAVTNGDIFIKDAVAAHNRPLISKLIEMGVKIEENDEGIRITGSNQLKPVDVKTMPHPGFPTDMQAQMTLAQLLSVGTTVMTETVFENRFMHFPEFGKMKADYKIEGNSVIMFGPAQLSGANVAATDLRAAAALVLAGLVAEGETRVSNLQYLDRGYYHFTEKLRDLGANIRRVAIDESGRESLVLNTIPSVTKLA
ncbi:UDP-N-acetylglucosamine 1-carboxyvinyltransferase [Companilactobacillus paralimentarius DSM 13238 = JCM 10415]|uniref:UDP-N-acetylglucosamine 1-carboxyvinyltransferase n=1 Tax=Companilactobacillus paralimentarius DSM 13238 = JCM 10415 TaxID=1122151 RepID=A0A0R1PQ10_9LACO|nr:UDP-N-acetylglucosamine 1-carboxyvinyltransferase [Companilactobacillus paralimentarius]KAE9565011.1 UDP-N-acetylglucosamine 1-carboxyvinyltransferase [Companilactobacillus paralimentarius]KRL32340.1 UDP-N-acetylglucosamine 1-carboxyvinyltransferase [Companilactobacillus paralimentarius DSM 13238 = JCM 10415]MDR4933709.1 UDP-N-acetylglucosamine 1-carboxyvinyltransferase [Companilactobacillus paralimentarius]QFR70165.1 UDP-N-acetylglucosamine 1-carboxyvinyltransferase [Companilactobacillus pa